MSQKPAAIIQFNNSKEQIHLKILASRPASKLAKSTPGVEYLPKTKTYLLPVEQVSALVRGFQEKNQIILVEQEAKDFLLETQDLRNKIIRREYQASYKELKDCLLAPIVQKISEGKYSLRSYTTKQLKLLFPEITNYQERKNLSANLSITMLGELVWRAKLIQIKVWLSQDVREGLLNFRDRLSSNLEDDFEEWQLGLITPENCFTIDLSGRPILLLKSQKSFKDLSSQFPEYAESPFWEGAFHIEGATLVTLYDSKLIEISKESFFSKIPQSKRFKKFLLNLFSRAKLLAERDYFNSLSDFNLTNKNQVLVKKLYPHQRVAIAWILKNQFCFVADDMGLGKTLSVLAAFQELKYQNQSNFLLVICPNSLVLNWIEEVKRWLPELEVLTSPESKKQRIQFLKKIKEGILNPDILVINYEEARLAYVATELIDLVGKKNTFLCLDESQRVKNPLGVTFKAISKVAKECRRRVLLSGTPSPRDFADLWSQQYLLDQGTRFGRNYYEWLEEVAELGSKWSRFTVKSFKPQAVQEYLFRFQELLLRRKKTDVINLPAKIFSRRDLKLSGDQLFRYNQIREDLLVQLSNISGEAYHRSIDNVLEQFLRAVQVASNPRIIDASWKGEPVKFLELDQIVEELISQDQKVVIWTNFTENIRELVIRYQKYGALPYYGAVKTVDRQKYINDFQSTEAGSARILVAIPAAGGVGINLTRASSAVYLDKTWNAEHWLQSIDRIYRIGQTKSVNIISLNACPVDYIISKNLKQKQQVLEQVMDQNEVNWEQLTPSYEELLDILKSNSYEIR